MVLEFDFSTILTRLDVSIKDLREKKNENVLAATPYIRDAKTTLRECLNDMHKNHIRVCVVHFPDGLQHTEQYSSIRHPSVSKKYDTVEGYSEKILSDSKDTPLITINSHESSEIEALLKQTEPNNNNEKDILLKRIKDTFVLLDMHDVVCLVVERFTEAYDATNADQNAQLPHECIEKILDVCIGDIANISGKNHYTIITEDQTLQELLLSFEQSPRIPIFSSEHLKVDDNLNENNNVKNLPELLGVFAVTDFMKFLEGITPIHATSEEHFRNPAQSYSKKFSLTPLDTWTAGMIKSSAQPPNARRNQDLTICFEDESLLEALKLLHKTGYSAIPIVAQSNCRQCLGVFSITDLQPILLHTAQLLKSSSLKNVSVLEYISVVRQFESLKARYPVIYIKENATLDAVIGKILAAKVQRLILKNNDDLLTGILSLTDLGRFIAHEFAANH